MAHRSQKGTSDLGITRPVSPDPVPLLKLYKMTVIFFNMFLEKDNPSYVRTSSVETTQEYENEVFVADSVYSTPNASGFITRRPAWETSDLSQNIYRKKFAKNRRRRPTVSDNGWRPEIPFQNILSSPNIRKRKQKVNIDFLLMKQLILHTITVENAFFS